VKESITKTLNEGLAGLVKQRKVTLIQGTGKFYLTRHGNSANQEGTTTIRFDQAIIAAGSHPTKYRFFLTMTRVYWIQPMLWN